MDRARAQTVVDENGDPDPAGPSRVFVSRCEIDDLTVSATVYPASGFVSVAESDAAVWRQLLTGVGGMDNVAAATLAEPTGNRVVDVATDAAIAAGTAATLAGRRGRTEGP